MILRTVTAAAIIATATFTYAGGKDNVRQAFTARTPLGSDNLRLVPANSNICVMVTLDTDAMGNLWRVNDKKGIYVQDSSGKRVKTYPKQLSFRITAGTKSKLQENIPHEIETSLDARQFVSRLRYRLKIFHGLETRTVEATEIKNIGVPVNLPYDERIWHVTFPVENVSVDDRLMLEVLGPDGNRISKFHMELI